MADKKKSRKKGQEVPVEDELVPTKLEYSVASYLKNNVPTKKTKFLSHQVNYFTANKAVDLLLESQWATGSDVIFTDRESVVKFCDRLLRLKFFHRARKIAITDKDLKPKELKKKKEREKEEKKRKEQEEKEKQKEKEKEKLKDKEKGDKEKEENAKEEEEEDRSEDKDSSKEKKKKKAKIKLDMHLDQTFIDGNDAYVWMYDPIPFWYYIAGALCLIAAVAICLFPIWPPGFRVMIYYLSMAAAIFFVVILGLSVVRFIIFVILWCLSMGRHHFWILPNLTEDVGFFASFWPLYQYEYRGNDYKKKKSKKKKKEEQDEEMKNQDNKCSEEIAGNTSAGEADTEAEGDRDKNETEAEKTETEAEGDRSGCEQTAPSETESENSNSQTFEMLSKDELSDSYSHQNKKDD